MSFPRRSYFIPKNHNIFIVVELNGGMFDLFGRWARQEKMNAQTRQQLSLLDNSLQESFNKVKGDVATLHQWIAHINHHNQHIDGKLTALSNQMVTRDEIRAFVDQYYKELDLIKHSQASVKNELSGEMYALQEHVSSTERKLKEAVSEIAEVQKGVFSRLDELKHNRVDHEKLKSEIKTDLISEMKEVASNRVIEETELLRGEMNRMVEGSISQAVFDRLDSMNKRLEELQRQPLNQKQTQRESLKEKVFRRVTRHSKEYVKSMLVSLIKKYQKISGLALREIVVEEQGIVSKSSFYRLLTEVEDEEGVSVVQDGKEKHYYWGLNQVH